MKSLGYINLRIVALLLSILAGIPSVSVNYFYGRDIEMTGYSEITEIPSVRTGRSGVDFTLENEGRPVVCRLSFCGREGWRLQSGFNGEISDCGAAQLLSYYLDEDNPCSAEPVEVTIGAKNTLLAAGDGSSAEITYKPFGITFRNKSGGESAVVTDIAENAGKTIVRGKLRPKEAMWGSGQHFDTINQRGQHIEINAIDQWALIERNSYLPVPILVSSRGSGLFMNRFERMTIDVDSRIVPKNTWQFCIPGAPCDLFVYATENPADVLYGYSLLTGFAPEPAEWSYGTIVCRYYPEFTTVEGVTEMAEKMKENDFPWEGVIVEGFDAADTENLRRMSDTVHGMGKKLMLYSATGENPLRSGTDEAQLMVRRASNGSINLIPANSNNAEDNPDAGTKKYLDITSEITRQYIFGTVWDKAVNEYGVDGAKVDFCELFPDSYELSFADGKTSGAHHWYPVLYNTLLFGKLSENPGGAMTINRGGGIGAQRYSWIWMGDQKREFRFIAAQLKAVMCCGISGIPFGTFDMGGYKSPAKNETAVFRRAIEFTAFTGNIQTHGTVKRPYDYDDTTKAIYGKYAKIHDALRPYLIEQGRVSCKTGLPLVRHLAIDYWKDSKVWDIEDEFMLGNKLLVAPVLEETNHRNIYLPEGKWINLWTGKEYNGGRTLLMFSVPDDEIPVFINCAAQSDAFDACRDEVLAIYSGK